jgi:hypothetical protein
MKRVIPSAFRLAVASTALLAARSSPTRAWDEVGHVVVTRAAHCRLPDRMPDWIRSADVRSRLEYLAVEPDRWRGLKDSHLDHTNNPEHYIDADDLAAFDLTLRTLPPLRRQFLDKMAVDRFRHPEKMPPYDAARDRNYVDLIPGLLPYRMAELHATIISSWSLLKTYEKCGSRIRPDMLRNARENVVYPMGILSHYVGDGAQPLHLTRHHHGWVGDNPGGYTRERSFHSYIDGGVIDLHGITPDSIVALARPPRAVSRDRYFADLCAYLDETFRLVEPLYAMDKSGDLRKEPGRKFIESRLAEGGAMLAGMWVAAYDAADIDEYTWKKIMGRDTPLPAR